MHNNVVILLFVWNEKSWLVFPIAVPTKVELSAHDSGKINCDQVKYISNTKHES